MTPEAGDSDAEVLVQGIADLVLVFDDHAEICDYKTDGSKTPTTIKRNTPPSCACTGTPLRCGWGCRSPG